MSAAIAIPSSGYWPIGSSTRLSGLSRSDFVLCAGFSDAGVTV
jgi:hypothetical protein